MYTHDAPHVTRAFGLRGKDEESARPIGRIGARSPCERKNRRFDVPVHFRPRLNVHAQLAVDERVFWTERMLRGARSQAIALAYPEGLIADTAEVDRAG